MSERNPSVLWNQSQSLTEAEKAQARENIGASSSISLPPYNLPEAGLSLCVNDIGSGLEWASRIKGSLVEDDGQGSTITTDLKNLKINLNSTAKGVVRVTPRGGSIQIAGWLAPDFDSFDDAGKCLTVASDGLHLEWSNQSGTQADWTATSGSSMILHKPSLIFRAYGAQDTELTGLKINADDPEGYVTIGVNNQQSPVGYLLAGAYKTLLDSGINNGSGRGSETVPVYINSSGQFATCTPFPRTNNKINVFYTITSTDIANGYAMVDMFEFPVPNDQDNIAFIAAVSGLNWYHGIQSRMLTNSVVSAIEVWGTRSDHTTIGYMYRKIDGSELATTDAHHAMTHPSDGYWNIIGSGSGNGSTMRYLTFKIIFAAGTTLAAGDQFNWCGQLTQLT